MKTVYCDGSTTIKNKKGFPNKGGFGYVAYDESGYIIDAYSEQTTNTTNNEMELKALITALKRFGTSDPWECPTIYSDSQYAIKCLFTWGQQWKYNGWKRSNGEPIENLALIKKGLALINSGNYIAEVQYCKGHSGIVGNELADKLATGEMTPEEVFYSDVKNKIPNMGYFVSSGFSVDSKFKDDINYWITGIEDGFILPNIELQNWYNDIKKIWK